MKNNENEIKLNVNDTENMANLSREENFVLIFDWNYYKYKIYRQ